METILCCVVYHSDVRAALAENCWFRFGKTRLCGDLLYVERNI